MCVFISLRSLFGSFNSEAEQKMVSKGVHVDCMGCFEFYRII